MAGTDPLITNSTAKVVSLHELVENGSVLITQAQMPDAIRVFTEALGQIAAGRLQNTATHLFILETLGDLHFATGDYRQAEEHLLRFLAIDDKSNHSLVVRLTLAKVYHASDQVAQALTILKPTIEAARRVTGTEYDPTLIADALWLEAVSYRALNKIPEAVESCVEAIARFTEVFGDTHPRTLVCQATLDRLSLAVGDISDVATSAPRVLRLLRKRLAEKDPDLIAPLVTCANVAFAIARELFHFRTSCRKREEPHPKEAVLENLRSLGLDRRAHSALAQFDAWVPNKELRAVLKRLGAGLLKGALAHLQEALNILRSNVGVDHPDNADLLDKLRVVCECLGKEGESASYEAEASRVRELNSDRTRL